MCQKRRQKRCFSLFLIYISLKKIEEMKSAYSIIRSLFLLSLFMTAGVLYAQEGTPDSEFKPRVGQEGKDVVWVPTPQELVDTMLSIAKVTSRDFVIDLGSGDGRTVISAAKLGARARGIEFNPNMVELSKKNAEEAGVGRKAEFINADIFESDISEATVITLFLLTDLNLRLRPQLLELKPGTRVVSNTFTMGDWKPDKEATTSENNRSWNNALLWIIPAKVEGTWKIGESNLELTQEYQFITGTLETNGSSASITDGKLTGEMITFAVNGSEYKGRVNGNTITGTMTNGRSTSNWTARKSD
jgi:SAM-dependent methyltransferase